MDIIMDSPLFPTLTFFTIGPADNLLQNTFETMGCMFSLAWQTRLFFIWPSLTCPTTSLSHYSHYSWEYASVTHTFVFLCFSFAQKAIFLFSPLLLTFNSSLKTQLNCHVWSFLILSKGQLVIPSFLLLLFYKSWILHLAHMKLIHYYVAF